MAVCPFCKKKVTHSASRCPYCTSHLAGNEQWEQSKKFEQTGWSIIILLFVGILIYLQLK